MSTEPAVGSVVRDNDGDLWKHTFGPARAPWLLLDGHMPNVRAAWSELGGRCHLLSSTPELTELRDLVIDLLRKVIPDGEDADGFITGYYLPTGPVHRLAARIPGQLRVTPKSEPERLTAAEWADRLDSRLNKLAEAVVHPARAQGPHPRTDDVHYLDGYQQAILDLRALGGA